MSGLRKGREYDAVRYKFMGVCEANNTPCWLCGKPINYTAPPQTSHAFELDHAQPISTHPELANNTSNFRASHSSCNRARGDKPIPIANRGNCTVWADW